MIVYYNNNKIKALYKQAVLSQKISYKVLSKPVLNVHYFDIKINDQFNLKDTTNVFYKNLTWQSSNNEIATVNNKGQVFAHNKGQVNITCTNAYGESDVCQLNIFSKEDLSFKYDDIEQPDNVLYAIDARDYQEGNWIARKAIDELKIVNLTGQVVNGGFVFDGTKSLDLSLLNSTYGFGGKSYSDYANVIELEFNEFRALEVASGIFIDATGLLYSSLSSVRTNIKNLELNKKYKLIILRRHRNVVNDIPSELSNFMTRIIIENEDTGWIPTGGGHWATSAFILSTKASSFIGKLYSYKMINLHYNAQNLGGVNNNTPTLEGDRLYLDGFINDYIINGFVPYTYPTFDFVDRRMIYDLASEESLSLVFRIIDNNNSKIIDFTDKTFDLLEMDIDDCIKRIYKDKLKIMAGVLNDIELDENVPYRGYKRFALYDNRSKQILPCHWSMIRTTDSRIDKTVPQPESEEDVIAKFMYISPREMIGRPGDKKLLRVTFVPEQVQNIKVKYISSNPEVASVGLHDGVVEFKSEGYSKITAISLSNEKVIAKALIKCDRPILDSEKVTIDVDKYNIIANNMNNDIAYNNIANINQALLDYKNQGYKQIKLPSNYYYVNCEDMSTYSQSKNTKAILSIKPQSHTVFDITDCTIHCLSHENPDSRVFIISGDNVKLLNGHIIGDGRTHNYGMRLNESGDMLEEGSYSFTDGSPINPDTEAGETYKSLDSKHDASQYMRYKGFIDCYTDDYDKGIELPSKFSVNPLWKTSMNTVDGGQYYIYYFNENNEFISGSTGGFGYRTMPEGAKKIKLSFRSENRPDAIYYITRRDANTHGTFEFGAGGLFTNAYDSEFNGTIIEQCQGDVSATMDGATYFKHDNGSYAGHEHYVCDCRWINCDLKEARRQGISFVATGENYLILDTKIGKINGVDPQCGVDFEAYGRNEKYLFKNTEFYENRKWDMVDCFSGDIEIDSCTFDGAIGLGQGSYNWYIHDSKFIYNEEKYCVDDIYWNKYKIHNTAGISAPINRKNIYSYSISENNYLNGGSTALKTGYPINGGATYSFGKNNIVENSNACAIGNNSENAIIKTNAMYIRNNIVCKNFIVESTRDNIENNKNPLIVAIENPSVIITSDDKEKYYWKGGKNGLTFISNTFGGQVNNCMLYNYTSAEKSDGDVILNDCDIINDDNLSIIGPNFGGATKFNNCNITIPRVSCAYNYAGGAQLPHSNAIGRMFENCTINIFDVESTNNKESIDLFAYGYGFFRCPIFLKNCIINSNKTVRINAQTDNCTFTGGAVDGDSTKIESIVMNNANITASLNTAIDIPITVTPSKRILFDMPIDSGLKIIAIGPNYTISGSKVGTYKVIARSADGTNLSTEFTVTIS